VSAAQQCANDDEDLDPEDGAGEDDDERYTCSLPEHINSIESTVLSRQDVLLTDEQVSILQSQVAEFRSANDPNTRSTIIQDVVSQLERSWGHDMDIDRELIQTVHALSARLPPLIYL
jgi:hypothetical protein